MPPARPTCAPGFRWCWKCKQQKPNASFCKDRGGKDGLGGYCKDCRHLAYLKCAYDRNRARVLETTKGKCAICSSEDGVQVHHKTNRIDGGKDVLENLIPLCYSCHKASHNGAFAGWHGSSRVLSCERCGHTWLQRKEDLPKTCAKCKSPYWNKPRIRKMAATKAA